MLGKKIQGLHIRDVSHTGFTIKFINWPCDRRKSVYMGRLSLRPVAATIARVNAMWPFTFCFRTFVDYGASSYFYIKWKVRAIFHSTVIAHFLSEHYAYLVAFRIAIYLHSPSLTISCLIITRPYHLELSCLWQICFVGCKWRWQPSGNFWFSRVTGS